MKTTFKQFLNEMNYGSLVNKDKYDRLDSADQHLYTYTADGFTAIDSADFKTLAKRYPFDGGVVYRGLHFDTQEQHDDFMKKIKDGELHVSSNTSWTVSQRTAKDFARTKKSYWPTPELMKAESERNKAGDFMTGYGGVVMKMELPAGIAVDVNKSDFAKESEVLVPPGTYKIEVHELIVPYRRQFDTKEKAKEAIKHLKSHPDKNAIANFLNSTWGSKLDPEDVDVLIEHFCSRALSMTPAEFGEKSVVTEYRRNYLYHDGEQELVLSVHTPFEKDMLERATPKMQAKIKRYTKAQVEALKRAVSEILKSDQFEMAVDYRFEGFGWLSQFTDLSSVVKPLRQALAAKYHTLNSREVNRTINHKNMDAHVKKIESLMKAIASLG
jgi:hypothetical protein